MPYGIEFEPDTEHHLKMHTKSDRVMILDSINDQLTHTPAVETRNRKLLRPNPLSQMELRIGAFRVFYDVIESEKKVRVVAVGHKEHERLLIGGKEFTL